MTTCTYLDKEQRRFYAASAAQASLLSYKPYELLPGELAQLAVLHADELLAELDREAAPASIQSDNTTAP
jgi:hypothetical protein